MKILVTGGAGFIGSAVIREALVNTNYEVLNLDKLTYAGNLSTLASVLPSARYRFQQVDICDRLELDRAFEQFEPDVVMHLAAESHVDRSVDASDVFLKTNVLGTYELLEAARAYWYRLSANRRAKFKFHHVSTDEVYGDLQGNSNAFTEKTPYAPSSPYAATKASADHLVRSWHRTYGLPVVITNCSNNYGPFHFPEKLIPHMIIRALLGQPLPVYGSGEQCRDWLFVEDHARALLLVAAGQAHGQTYNIGGHNERRNIDVVHQICDILEELQPSKVRGGVPYRALVQFVQDRPGHDKRYAIDASKIADELAWYPLESFDSGLRKTVQWYIINRKWWENILDKNYQLERIGNSVE